MSKYSSIHEYNEFSIVRGGPLYIIWRRIHLAGDRLQLCPRRIFFLVLLVWAPLLLLSLVEGYAWGSSAELPFLRDAAMNVRLLLALPLLILGEPYVHKRMTSVVGQFITRDLIPESQKKKFDAAIDSAIRLRNSIVAEMLLLAFVYSLGAIFTSQNHTAFNMTNWYSYTYENGTLQRSLAGLWLGVVSLPLFQFLFLRWYFRLFIWTRFLWQVSRIELRLLPMHPDQCAGLGFLSLSGQAFAPVLVAQGMLLSGMIANRIFYTGAKLIDFQLEILFVAMVLVFVVLGPLLVFTPRLIIAKRKGLREYGTLAQFYVREFDRKWQRGVNPTKNETLLGSADIQSLADLGGSYETIKNMRFTPFSLQTVLQLLAITVAPILPLILIMIPLDKLLTMLIKLAF